MRSLVLAILCLASPAAAVPVIHSVTPSSGPTAGGVTLTIIGSDFDGASVLVGEESCAVTQSAADTLHCTAPEGQGLGIDVRVLSSTGAASNTALFNFEAPYIDDLSPAAGPTSGVTLTIQGDNFGVSRTVLVGKQPCLVDDLASSHTEIVCEVPPGAGAGHAVQVSVGEQRSNLASFDYEAPSIDEVSPASGPVSGGTLLTISGAGFGASGATAFIGHQECVASEPQTHTSLVCSVPEGDGQELPVWLSVAGQVSPPAATAVFSYAAPSLLNLSPATGPVSGNIIITISGASFGDAARVSIGGRDCPVESRSSSSLACTLPEGAGGQLPVVVSRGSLTSNALSFTYASPALTDITPAAGPTRGGVLITISGSNFSPGRALVRVGASSCGVVSGSSDQLVCALPPGSGVNQHVQVVQAGQAANLGSFDYLAPSLSLVSPAHGPTSGQVITLVGDNFGASAATVSIGTASCEVETQDHSRITCEVPAGVGAGHAVSVTQDDLTSNTAAFSFDAPLVTGVSPAFGERSGGTPITIYGTSFGADGAAVSIGGLGCPVETQEHGQIVCELPPGEGRGVPLVVSVGGQSSSGGSYDYASDGPSAEGAAVETDEDTPLLVQLSGTDPEGQALSYLVTAAPPASSGSVSLQGDRLLFVPAPDFSGTTEVEFTVDDGESTSASAVVEITVLPMNDAPVLATLVTSSPEDTLAEIELAATDADGDALTYALVTPPEVGSVTLEGSLARYSPPADFVGTVAFEVSATDPSLASSSGTLVVQVTGTADAPFASAQSVSTLEDQLVKLWLAGADADGDGLSFSLVALPSHGAAALSGDALTYIPAPDFAGDDAFTFVASDELQQVSPSALVSITVVPVNDPPLLAALALATENGGRTTVELVASDADGDALSFALGTPPPETAGTATLEGSTLRFTAARGFSGEAAFTVTVSDGASSHTAAVSVVVGAPPKGGSHGGGCAAAGEGVSVALLLLGLRRRR